MTCKVQTKPKWQFGHYFSDRILPNGDKMPAVKCMLGWKSDDQENMLIP